MKVFWGNNSTTGNKCKSPTKYPAYMIKHDNFLKREMENKVWSECILESLCSKMTAVTSKPNLVFTAWFCCFPLFF